MEKQFGVVVEYVFNDLMRHGEEFQAELNRLEHLKTGNYEKILTEKEFQEFEKVLGVMSITSRKTVSCFSEIDKACIEALKARSLTAKQKKNVQEIQKITKDARNLELGYARRLPFSVGAGWEPNISATRMLVNAAGYLLMAPALFAEKGRAMYNKSLSNMKDAVEAYREEQERYSKRQGLLSDSKGVYTRGKERDKVKSAVKDLRIFMRLTRQVMQRWRRAQNDIQRILDNDKYSEKVSNIMVDGDEIFRYRESNAWEEAA